LLSDALSKGIESIDLDSDTFKEIPEEFKNLLKQDLASNAKTKYRDLIKKWAADAGKTLKEANELYF
jgi:hypothetical protein